MQHTVFEFPPIIFGENPFYSAGICLVFRLMRIRIVRLIIHWIVTLGLSTKIAMQSQCHTKN